MNFLDLSRRKAKWQVVEKGLVITQQFRPATLKNVFECAMQYFAGQRLTKTQNAGNFMNGFRQ